nr:endonuclease domain-containing protein [Jiella sp. LLJ827]
MQERLRGFAKGMRKAPTDAEYALWQMLRARRLNGLKFKRQEPLGPYICDFVCHERRLIVEADGWQHEGSKRDADRDRYFEDRGYRTIRFSNGTILEDADAVASQIIDAARR